MKRILALFLTIVMLLAIVSCNKNKEPQETTAEVNTQATTPEVTTPEETTPEDTSVTYTVTVVDENGAAISGATVQLCVGDICRLPSVTNNEGVATFKFGEADYIVKVTLKGYTGEAYYAFPTGKTELTVQLTKIPEETTPEEITPEEVTTPEETTPEETTPEETTPEETTPEVTESDVPAPDFNTPAEPTAKMAGEIVAELNPTEQFEATFDCQEAIFAGARSANKVLAALWQEGYTRLDVDTVEGAKFDIYLLTKADELVTVYWIPASNEVRVIWEKANVAALATLQKNASTGKGFLTMVQIGVERGEAVDNPMIGLCYIFKLENGNAIVIDGGYYYDECAENLYNSLVKMDIAQNAGEQYIIEAWIFTHAHGDHNGILSNFVPLYGDKVEVKNFLYQFPTNNEISVDVGLVGAAGEVGFYQLCKEAFPNATIINPHVGLKYYFGNATVDMLYTPDALWNPQEQIDYYNNNSLIFKVNGGETAFLCLGDAGNDAAATSWKLFEASAYESDIFQLSHHGMSTGSGAEAWIWDSLEKIYTASGANLVALPLGTRISNEMTNSGNGRWAILFDYPYNKKNQMAFIVARGDAPTANGYFTQELLSRFTATVESGHNYIAESSTYASFANIKSLHGYNGINMIDNGHGLITYISCADQTEMATEFLFAHGEVTVKNNQKLDAWLSVPEVDAEDVVESINPEASVVAGANGTQMVVLGGVSDKATIVDQLIAAGFEAIETVSVPGAKFETLLFTNGYELVTVYWKAEENEARIFFEEFNEALLPLLVPDETYAGGDMTIVQIGNSGIVVKVADGRAIVIDGGAAGNEDLIYNALSKLNVKRNEQDEYIIAAWMFTYASENYTGVVEAFSNKYREKTEVQYIIYNANDATLSQNCNSAYPNAEQLIAKAGIRYFFGGATVDMLYTPDYVWAGEGDYNDTGLVSIFTGAGLPLLFKRNTSEEVWVLVENSYLDYELIYNELSAEDVAILFTNGQSFNLTSMTLVEWLAEPTCVDTFESTFDSFMEVWTNVKDVNMFVDPLVEGGFKVIDITMIAGAKFETIILQRETEQVTFYWFPATGDLRIAYDTIQENATTPLLPNEETGKGEVLVAQIGVDIPDPENLNSTENNPNIGLCYIFKLSNGRAIILDGGWNYESNADNLFYALESFDIAKDENGEFIIEAWIFTHGHGDHNGIISSFFPKYGHLANVNYFVYQIPANPEIGPMGGGIGEANFHALCKEVCPESTYINPRAGVTYYFGNATLDMLHTPDITWCHEYRIPDYNDTGLIFRISGGGVEGALFMGDAGEYPSAVAVKNYDVSAFNANILQISHHGLNTQINEGHAWKNMKIIYEGATVEYAFLPMGTAKPNIRSGRWSVIVAWGYTGKQASFVIDPTDNSKGVSQNDWNKFVAGILDGSIVGETFLGYDGYNVIDNGRGVTTYIHASETATMVTIMSFANGEVTVEYNEELRFWIEITH